MILVRATRLRALGRQQGRQRRPLPITADQSVRGVQLSFQTLPPQITLCRHTLVVSARGSPGAHVAVVDAGAAGDLHE